MFWPLQSSFEFSGVPKDSKFPLLGMWISSSHLFQSGVATYLLLPTYHHTTLSTYFPPTILHPYLPIYLITYFLLPTYHLKTLPTYLLLPIYNCTTLPTYLLLPIYHCTTLLTYFLLPTYHLTSLHTHLLLIPAYHPTLYLPTFLLPTYHLKSLHTHLSSEILINYLTTDLLNYLPPMDYNLPTYLTLYLLSIMQPTY
jgi:hypothetical protein